MTSRKLTIGSIDAYVSRCGYTGEDGFEISIPNNKAKDVCELLVGHKDAKLAGLACRDSLRIEAGLCLYGQDINEDTTPSEAGLNWTVGKRRRAEGGFLGSDVILNQIKSPSRRRIGLLVEGAPARQNAEIYADDKRVGIVTSGCPSPSLGQNISMAYVENGFHKPGLSLNVKVRNKMQIAKVVKMPFVSPKYHRISL